MKNSYKNRIASYQKGAESYFNNANGNQGGGSYGYNNMGGGDGYNNFSNAGILDPNNRTLTITVANANTTTATATIFGSVFDLTDANLASGVTITVAQSTHLQVKTELLQNIFRILGLKYTVTTTAQFSNSLAIYEADSTGGLIRRYFTPLSYRAAQNNLTTQIDAPTFELLVNANVYIQFTLAASETVTFDFTLVERTEAKNLLRNRPVVTVSPVPQPTGIPQVDMKTLGMRRF